MPRLTTTTETQLLPPYQKGEVVGKEKRKWKKERKEKKKKKKRVHGIAGHDDCSYPLSRETSDHAGPARPVKKRRKEKKKEKRRAR